MMIMMISMIRIDLIIVCFGEAVLADDICRSIVQ